MDLIIVIILGLLLFVLPELLRSKKKQQYEYPEIPEPAGEMHRPPVYYEGEGVSAEYGLKDTAEGVSVEWEEQTAKDKDTLPAVANIPPQMEEGNPWTGQLSLPHVVNGVIFAEILQSPRAKRPVPCWWRKQ